MDMNILRGIITLVVMILFIVICVLVYSKRNKKKYEQAARMVLDAEADETSIDEGQQS
ncbi:cbb3-type cytochrome c oxidase subunit 3 [Kangiella sp. TOML190]|uniref:cbb3-type cytochrome oxidase subunit 3 n=1 Tax=Kangiella sp. TOML190 TaxID=2931351 RepID=UPI00203A94F7|nr:cbb3-type cytochrome c oxidase subunit 3 [Kangiella sp. TOML190]